MQCMYIASFDMLGVNHMLSVSVVSIGELVLMSESAENNAECMCLSVCREE